MGDEDDGMNRKKGELGLTVSVLRFSTGPL